MLDMKPPGSVKSARPATTNVRPVHQGGPLVSSCQVQLGVNRLEHLNFEELQRAMIASWPSKL